MRARQRGRRPPATAEPPQCEFACGRQADHIPEGFEEVPVDWVVAVTVAGEQHSEGVHFHDRKRT
jgi:hypothetical protein